MRLSDRNTYFSRPPARGQGTVWHRNSSRSDNLPSQEQQSSNSTVLAQVKSAWQRFTKSIIVPASSTTTNHPTPTTTTTTTHDKMAVNGSVQVQPKSPVQLDVIVVGAGISGLATAISTALSGHNVTVFESAKELLEVITCPFIYLFLARGKGAHKLTVVLDRCRSPSHPQRHQDPPKMGPRGQTLESRGRAQLADRPPLLGQGARPRGRL